MKKLVLSSFILIFILVKLAMPVLSQDPVNGAPSAVLNRHGQDSRIEILRTFLQKYQSPLSVYAEDFIKAADFYEVDWRLVPSITGVESTFGKFIPEGSNNAYGWNNGNYNFISWEESIWHVTATLKNKYVDKGAKSISQIARIYAPPSATWAKNVSFFINKLQDTSFLTFNP